MIKNKFKSSEDESENETLFDQNHCFPGTEWMHTLNEEIELFIRRMVTENSVWRRLTIIYDDHLCPGEACHKILKWIKRESMSNNAAANVRHCMYGLDTKCIVTALVLHEHNFVLMHDELLFGTEHKDIYARSRRVIGNDECFQLLHMSILREYLKIEFEPYHIENIVDDFVFLILLNENDYLPSISCLNMEILMESYKEILPPLPCDVHPYLVDEGSINFELLHELFLNLHQRECGLLIDAYEGLTRHYQRLSGYKYDETEKKETDKTKLKDVIRKLNGNQLEITISTNNECCMDMKELNDLLRILKNDDSLITNEYASKYYSDRFGISHFAQIDSVCNDYLKTLEWILRYYHFGNISWIWSYNYHYAPLIADLMNVKLKCYDFVMGAPLTPFEQLMVVLPSESHSRLMPEYCFQFVNDEKFKPFKSLLYPCQYFIDTNYHLTPNKVLPLLPFVNIVQMQSLLYEIEMDKKEKLIKLPMTEREKQRNTFDRTRIFRFDREKATDKLKLYGPLSFGAFPDIVSCIRNKTDHQISMFSSSTLYRNNNNIRESKLRHFDFTPSIKQIGLKAFGFCSKNSSLILGNNNPPNDENDTRLINSLFAGSVYCKFPYFIEANVVYVETRRFIYEQYNKYEVLSDGEMFNFDQRCLKLSNNLLQCKGIDVGVINTLVHVYPLIGNFRQENRMKIVKRFSSEIHTFPMQLIWTQDRLSCFDSRYMDRKIDKKLELKIGSAILYMGNQMPLFGVQGKITSQTRNGLINIRLFPHPISRKMKSIRDIIQKYQQKAVDEKEEFQKDHRWYSLPHAAELLNIQKMVLKRILEHIFIVDGRRKIQIGLNLFNFKKRLIVPEYTRIAKKYAEITITPKANATTTNEPKEKDAVKHNNKVLIDKRRKMRRRRPRYVFEISQKTLEIVMSYRSKFPGVFRVIQQKPSLITFGSHFFSPNQIPTNFNPYIVSRVVGVSPSGLSSNFQNIFNINHQKKQEEKEREEEVVINDADDKAEDAEEVDSKQPKTTPMSRLFSPRKPRFPHDLDNPSSATTKNSKLYKGKGDDLNDELPPVDVEKEQDVDNAVISIRDAFKAKIHAAAMNDCYIKDVQTEDEDVKKNEEVTDDGLCCNEMGLRYVMQVHQWLNGLNLNKLGLIDANSIVVPTEALQEIENEINKAYQQKRYRKNNIVRLEKVPIHQIYAADPATSWTPTPRRLWQLGDRCSSLRSDSSIPFGSTGTVIGIHVNFLEILMDKQCICGTDLCHKVTDLRGVTLPYDTVINISKPFHSYSHQDLIPMDQFPRYRSVNSKAMINNSSYHRYRHQRFGNQRFNNQNKNKLPFGMNHVNNRNNRNQKYRPTMLHNKGKESPILSSDNRNRHRTSPIYGPIMPSKRSPNANEKEQANNNDIIKFQQIQTLMMQQPLYTAPDSFLEQNKVMTTRSDEGSITALNDSPKRKIQITHSSPFQPGSDEQKNSPLHNIKQNEDHHFNPQNSNSPNSTQRRKRKQPRSYPRPLHDEHQQPLSPNKGDEKQENKEDVIANISKQTDADANKWKSSFVESKSKNNSNMNMKSLPKESFSHFFDQLSDQAVFHPKDSPESAKQTDIKTNENDMFDDNNGNGKVSAFVSSPPKHPKLDHKTLNEHNILNKGKDRKKTAVESHMSTGTNLFVSECESDHKLKGIHSSFIRVFDKDAQRKVNEIYEKDLDSMFERMDIEICEREKNNGDILNHHSESTSTAPILLNFHQKQSVSDDGDSYNDDYKQQRIPHQARKRSHNLKRIKHTQKQQHFVSTPKRIKSKPKHVRHNNDIIDVSPVSSRISPSSSKRRYYDKHEQQEENKKVYVHPTGKKMSDESFKLMQKMVRQLEKVKYKTNPNDIMHEICQMQENICHKLRPTKQSKHHYQDEYENNSDEKMSTDHMSPQSPQMYYKETPSSPNKRSKKHKTSKYRATPKSNHQKHHQTKQKNSYKHTHYHSMNVSKINAGDGSVNNYSFNHNDHSITNINIGHDRRSDSNTNLRRRLSFHSQPTEQHSNFSRYDHLTSPEIIERQQQKLARTHQEIRDLHYELKCVYKALDAVRLNRDKLAIDKEIMNKEYNQRIKSIYHQLDQFKIQTELFQKEQRDIENDIRRQREPLMNASPVKSPKKSQKQRGHHRYGH